MIRAMFITMGVMSGSIFLLNSSCEQPPPSYVQKKGPWNPENYLWLPSPSPEAHTLKDHSFALANRPLRIPNARRRAVAPEKRALQGIKRKPKRKGPPGMVKVHVFQGTNEVDANVWLNGIKAGKAPMFVYLPAGEHEIRIQTSQGDAQTKKIEVRSQSKDHVVFRVPLRRP